MEEVNFCRSFKNDFFDDPSYIYVVKYMYKKGLNFSKVRRTGSKNFKGIKKKIPRKEMLKEISTQKRTPFKRWGLIGNKEIYIKFIKKRFGNYIHD